MLSIGTNINSLIAQKNLQKTNLAMETATQRLSSGLRINSAKDDAAGLAIATRFDSQIRGMNMAIRNANDATSLVQTADGAVSTMGDIFQRMRELAVQATNASYSADDRAKLNTEYQELATEATRIANDTNFNGLSIISGNAGTFSFQVGSESGQTLDVDTTDAADYLTTPGDLTSAANAQTAIGALDTALDSINTDRATYGAALSRLEFTVSNLGNSVQAASASRSRIMDADFAAETAALSKNQILQQAGVSMLAQANQMPKLVLNLLG